MAPITIALDWTPNTNHTGFYVARKKGFYKDAGIEVQILSPHQDEYKTTPGSRLVDGSATFACVPSESVISYHTWPNGEKPKIVAVAALLQSNQSAIVTLKYESRIVQQMIRADGGSGDYIETTPPMLGIWSTLLSGSADATWVFLPWEGVAAQRANVALNTFKLEDYGIPYCYSPVLAAHPDTLAGQPDAVRSFLAATARGYEWAAAHPKEAAALLCAEVAADAAAPGGAPLPEGLDPAMVEQSQVAVAGAYLHTSSSSSSSSSSSGAWGVMDVSVWEKFLDWLSGAGLLTSKAQSRRQAAHSSSLDGMRSGEAGEALPRGAVAAADMATNAFLPQAG
ncbi:NMT1/THI5 like-domain-containing protein [Scenedesmus sp. NREL 46B-D3]|nr:NMT1/THI5 like-domain-containing protein [Scenedesmus sp. NREL 46B-D3]